MLAIWKLPTLLNCDLGEDFQDVSHRWFAVTPSTSMHWSLTSFPVPDLVAFVHHVGMSCCSSVSSAIAVYDLVRISFRIT